MEEVKSDVLKKIMQSNPKINKVKGYFLQRKNASSAYSGKLKKLISEVNKNIKPTETIVVFLDKKHS